MTFLAIDIGNTRLKWAMFNEPRWGSKPLAHGAEFLDHIDRLAETHWAHLPAPQMIVGCAVAGEAVRRRVNEQLELWDVMPHWVHSSAQAAGLVNGYDQPGRLGADRWVAMIGARNHLLAKKVQKPLIVVMVGTAVTVEAIDASGYFLGGLILPGHGIMLRALESGTAGLNVPTGDVKAFPTNTSDALTSGGTFAITGAIERMMLHLKERTGTDPVCMMTGGAGWKVAPSMTRPVELVEGLIFDGLLAIAQERLQLDKQVLEQMV